MIFNVSYGVSHSKVGGCRPRLFFNFFYGAGHKGLRSDGDT